MKRHLTAALVALLTPALAGAEEPANGGADFFGHVRTRVEIQNDFDFDDSVDRDNSFVLYRTRLGATAPIDADTKLRLVLEDARTFGEEVAVPAGERHFDVLEGFLEQRDLLGASGLTGTLGRQQLAYGEERLVGSFNYGNASRTYDAARLRLTREGSWHDVWTSRVVDDPAYSQEQSLWGFYNHFELDGSRVLEGYLLRRLDPRAGVAIDDYTIGLRSAGPLAGALEYGVEGAFQTGDRGALESEAWSLHSALTYRFRDESDTRIVAEYDSASGDDDPTDATSETFDNLTPTNHYLYGIGDFFSWRNMSAFRLGASRNLTSRLFAGVDYWSFSLQSTRDHWYAASRAPFRRAPAAGFTSDDAGDELDLLVRFKWRPDLELELGAYRFMPGELVSDVGPADDAVGAYFQTLYKF